MNGLGPCAACGRNPAAGFASVTTNDGQRWYCHGDDDDKPTCYEEDWSTSWPQTPSADDPATRLLLAIFGQPENDQ